MDGVDVVDATLQSLAGLLGKGTPPTEQPPHPPAPPAPWPHWQGVVGDRAHQTETTLDTLRNGLYTTQQAACRIINEAGQLTQHARAQMHKIREAWRSDKAALAPIRNTPAGKLALLAAGQRRLTEAVGLIRQTIAEFTALSQRLRVVSAGLPLVPSSGPGQSAGVVDLGPIAGTGAIPGIPGIGAADLGEIFRLPDGRMVAVFGDAWSGNKMNEGDHYRSVAVLVKGFDDQGRPIFGDVLTGPMGSGRELFPFDKIPDQAKIPGVVDTLPAGTITIGKDTYMMVVGTDANLRPIGGSWLVKVTNNPAGGWNPVAGSWRPWQPTNATSTAPPTQISGYRGSDGMVYIAADSFDRGMNDSFHGVTMYRVDPATVFDRSTWQPWTGNGWGAATDAPTALTQSNFGEMSLREIDGHPVLSGFDWNTGNVEVRVANDPAQIFSATAPVTIIAQQSNDQAPLYVHQNYGGFLIPDTHLNDLGILVSKWDDADYQTRIFRANIPPPP